MKNRKRSIFDALISDISDSKRNRLLYQLYSQTDQTRPVFLAQMKEVAKFSTTEKQALAKVYNFADYLKKKSVAYSFKGTGYRSGKRVPVEGIVWASSESDAYYKLESDSDSYVGHTQMYEADIIVNELPASTAMKILRRETA